MSLKSKTTNTQVKLAVIGCGAVARERYLPASKLVPNLEIVYVVDANLERARKIARQFCIPGYTNDYREIFGKVDAAVVATPPKLHASISVDCLNHGIHVLCEKPMATSIREAQEMIKTSQRNQVHLAVNMNRRLCSSSQVAHFLIKRGFIGELRRFEAEEGYEFNWPLQSLHLFLKEEAGGGVLANSGPHTLDLLFWLIGKEAEILSYKDDNFGGVEANARIELILKSNDAEIPGVVELSLTRHLRNIIRVFGERGYIDIPVFGGESVYFHPIVSPERTLEIRLNNVPPKNRIKEFAQQLSRFADSILSGEIKYTPGTEAIPVIECIERCYKMRRNFPRKTLMLQPWESINIKPKSALLGDPTG